MTVPKPDGSVRICGDYKVTINPDLEVDHYPLPTLEDLFATLAGGLKFSKLDLSHAYQQVLLDEKSQSQSTHTRAMLYRLITTCRYIEFNIELSRSTNFESMRRFGPWTFFSHKTRVWHNNNRLK